MTGPPHLRALVVVASRHGGTTGIAQAVVRGLVAGGLDAVLAPAAHRPDPGSADAVVIGSAVYAGRWLDPARQYATDHAHALRGRPVWLFSSGPIGPRPFPPDEPHDVAPLTALTGAREHRVFPGRLDPAVLTVGERAMVTAMRAPVGDFRDWPAVDAWAARIAAAVLAGAPAGTG